MRTVFWFLRLSILGLALFISAHGQYKMEKINRGIIAVRDGNSYMVSWRLLGTEPHNLGFNLYRGETLLNSTPITETTMYVDQGAPENSVYTVKPVVNGQEGPASEPARVLGNYHSIPLQTPPRPSGEPNYTPNDASIADLDGDGEYEIVLKQEQHPKDNSHDDHTFNTVLEGYELDGTFMWRIQMGYNIREGAHYTQFMVYDLDGDGKAEIAVKTADGTIDGKGKVIGDGSVRHANSRGYIMQGPEFFTIFSGETGEELITVDYIVPRGNSCDWGDPDCATYANRVDRFLATVAYLDGVNPSVVMCRGYYTRTVLVAWDWRNGELTQRWIFDTDENGERGYTGQGNHSIGVADVDGDGKQEIIYGAATIDDDGTGLYNSRLGHGDAQHVSDLVPGRPGLEIWGIHEGTHNPGGALRDAATGEIIFQTPNSDAGRGMAGDVDPNHPGAEFWHSGSSLMDETGRNIGSSPNSVNFGIWWDGDLLRELLNGTSITKPSGGNMNLNASGCSSNNGTKSTPTLSADIWGDWREEVIFRCGNELRIFTTRFPTEYRFHTLMHDPQYRMAITWQNVAYNQPPHVGFYLGEGMEYPPERDGISPVNQDVSFVKPIFQETYMLTGTHYLTVPSGLEGKNVVVYDLHGKVVKEARVQQSKVDLGTQNETIGMYFVKELFR